MNGLHLLCGLALITLVYSRDPRCPIQQDDEFALFYPHDRNCSKFYTCLTNGTLAEMDCKDGLEFDYELSVCNWPGNNTCLLRTAQRAVPAETAYCSEDQEGLFIPNYDDNCKSFYKCENGFGQKFPCANGLMFNSKTGLCDWAQNVKCKAPSRATYVLPTCKDERDGSMFSNYADDCKTFYICNNGIAKLASCDGSLLFNPKTGACDWPQNVQCKCEGFCIGDPKVNGPCYGKVCPTPAPPCVDCAPGYVDPNPPCFGDNCTTFCPDPPTTVWCDSTTRPTPTTVTIPTTFTIPTTVTTPRPTCPPPPTCPTCPPPVICPTCPPPPTMPPPTKPPPSCCCCCMPCNNQCGGNCGSYRDAKEIDGTDRSSDNFFDVLVEPKSENDTDKIPQF